MNPSLKSLIKQVPSLQNIPKEERERYLFAKEFDRDDSYKSMILEKIGQAGHKIDSIPLDHAFDFVKLATLSVGEILMSAGNYAGFVYIPFSLGLKGLAGGGYGRFEVAPWTLLGNTGVIRGDIRNSTVFAEQELMVMIIPKEIYLKFWHHTYSAAEFKLEMIKRNKL